MVVVWPKQASNKDMSLLGAMLGIKKKKDAGGG